jgi:hypothetical protein
VARLEVGAQAGQLGELDQVGSLADRPHQQTIALEREPRRRAGGLSRWVECASEMAAVRLLL